MSNDAPKTISQLDPPANPIMRLVYSSKAIVVLAVTITTFGAVYLGRATFQQATDFLKYVIGPWLLAVGIEDAGRNNAKRPPDSSATNVVVSTPPPPS